MTFRDGRADYWLVRYSNMYLVVFAILSAKNWHWVNVVFLILTLITSITAIIGMTFAFDHRYEGLKAYRDAVRIADKKEAELIEIVGGDPLSVQYGKDSLRYSSNQLALAMTGRGISWSGRATAVEGEENQRKFTLESERDLAKEAALSGAIIYAFADNNNFPDRYIGSVLVVPGTETNAGFTLGPVDLADAERFNDPQTTWTLYEKMPQDRHGIFKRRLEAVVNSKPENAERSPEDQQRETFVEDMNDESKEFDIATFTEILKRDFLPAGRLGYERDSLAYEQMIDQYAFDGLSVSKIKTYVENTRGRKSNLFEPREEQVFIRYTFTAPSDIAVKTDGIGTLKGDGLFNPAGEAVFGKLMQNPDGVTFKKDDVIEIDERSSAEFEQAHAGKLKKIDEIFVRELQDFPLIFKDRKLRIAKLEDEIITAQATIEKTQAALKDANEQIDVRSKLLGDNSDDEKGFEDDIATLQQANNSFTQQSDELTQAIKDRKARINSLYDQIRATALQKLRGAVSVSN